MTDVTVIGAGVAGLCVATELVERGLTVTLVDEHIPPSPNACSWWAGGMLAPWCEGESADESVVRLGQEAVDWWEKHAGGVTRNGSLVVSLNRDQGELSRFARRTSRFEEIGKDSVQSLEPDLAKSRKGLFFKDEAHLAPRDALTTLVRKLETKNVRFERRRFDFGRETSYALAVDCRGLAAKDRLTDLRGVKGEMLMLRCPEITLKRPIRLLHPRIPIYLVPRGAGVFMLGATMIETANRSRATVRSVMELLSAAYALNPAFGEAEVLEIGVDARPAFPDNLPRIRRDGSVISVNGLFRHGFLLAPAMARMVADWILHNIIPEVCDDTVDA